MHSVFPIGLDAFTAKKLVLNQLRKEFDECKPRFGNIQYEYSALLHENGDVEVSVWCSNDTGFAQTAGTLLKETIRPFDEKKIAALADEEKTEIARLEYARRKQALEDEEIKKIRQEIFGS